MPRENLNMSGYYTQKTAFVTGAASGIGRSLALELSKQGAKIIGLLDINEKLAEETASIVRANGASAVSYKADVSDKASLKSAIDDFASKAGALDIIVNNAGVRFSTDETRPLADRFDDVVAINLLGEVYGSVFALEYMKKQGSGHIVNVASIAGLAPGISGLGYSTAKSGVVGYSMNARLYYKRYGVKVSVLCPSAVATPMEGYSVDGSVGYEEHDKKVKFITPDEFASIALKGVAKNKGIIPIGYKSRQTWNFYRMNPEMYLDNLHRFNNYSVYNY